MNNNLTILKFKHKNIINYYEDYQGEIITVIVNNTVVNKLRCDGGIRGHGFFKLGGLIDSILVSKLDSYDKLECLPLISIISVVFNGFSTIEKTIQSVVSQSYKNIEYIIIDGGSDDGTIEILKKYDSVVDYWITEKDNGIYNAMNKGINISTGKWIYFLNSGDLLFSENTISELFENKDYGETDIIYGNHIVSYPTGINRHVIAGNHQNLWKGSQFCHQACFVKTKYHKLNKFNEKNKIVADFEFFYHALCTGAKFKSIHNTVVIYQSNGISDTNRLSVIVGWWRIVEKSFFVNLKYLSMINIELLKQIIKKLKSI
jgi:glycosyltransferase involved in cell wall biosynthesis